MTLDDTHHRKINHRKINHDAITQITRTRHITTPFFHARRGGLTSVEIRAHFSEISRFLALSARWLRESLQRETPMAAQWAASGGW